ncbi:MAG: ADP-ribosylglycohydrolase family protein [Ruminococcus sp.]|nr:ADP-ribosylglycohydrolase family protein [Ruminococcus sp.]MDE6848526.1 ADP-ribosylglycohydrolase family protein [Ruminococcus sp.]
METLNKYKACLLGGAIGDALGYAVEFERESSIFSKYGKNGITEYKLKNGMALFSDDTQMTLFTANGLLSAYYNKNSYTDSIHTSYKEWYITQSLKQNNNNYHSWIMKVPQLWVRRAPGMTCISAITSRQKGSVRNPINDSKGCGGVMRVAPVGLFFKNTERISQTDMLAAEISAITHGHELGYIPSATLAHIINLISHNEKITLKDAVLDSISHAEKLFKSCKHIGYFSKLMHKAVKLSEKKYNDLESVHELGEGWVAEETLAIAVYCALKYENDFEKAVVTSVNHNGDSDSTGAVTGNIIGAYLGMDSIPRKFLDNLEIRDVISEIAEDLYNYDIDEHQNETRKKYIL